MAQRMHNWVRSKFVAFVDSSASCDLNSHPLTFMLCPTFAGAVCIGVIVTENQSELAYTTGFGLLKECLGPSAFGGQGFPNVFMTDDSDAERAALKVIWPESDQKLCLFHVPQAMWKWLWEGKHKIELSDRKILMNEFRDIINSLDETAAFQAFEKAITSPTAVKYPKHIAHLRALWEATDKVTGEPKRVLWCKVYRLAIMLGWDTNNFSEAQIRVFKDVRYDPQEQKMFSTHWLWEIARGSRYSIEMVSNETPSQG